MSRQREFLGIGDVRIDGVKLRSERVPLATRLDTPDGVLYTKYYLDAVTPASHGGAEVRLRAIGYPWGRTEYADDYGQPLVNLSLPPSTVEDRLILTLRPAALSLGGMDWRGFSYSYRFESDGRRIHRLMVRSTWEIGGSIVGNTVLSQGQCNMPVYRGQRQTLFTTACLRTLDQYSSPQGNSFQLGPRAGLIQGFDFQFSEQGVLFQYWPDFRSISSLVESPRGSTLLHVVDEHRVAMSRRVATTPKCVLFCAGAFAECECRDLWWHAHERVYGGIRKRFGITPTRVVPEMDQAYTARFFGRKFKMTVQGVPVDPPEVLYALADKTLPVMARQGVKRFMPEVSTQSDVTELGLRRKLDDGIHGDLHCSSVCATHRFLPSDFWGGIKAWRYLADKARSLGMEIGCWFAPHFSPRAPIFREHPEYRMIDVTGLPAGGGYGFQTITVADWNTGIYDWVLNDFRRWQSEGGLDYIFTDSFSNMGLLQVNYAAAMRTNLEPLGRFYADLQKLGIASFSFESVSPYGISRFGVADLRGDLMGQDHAVAGQNDFGWWVGEEDMAFGLCLATEARRRSERELRAIAFRIMASRGYLMLGNLRDERHRLPDWLTALHRTYNGALPHMRTRQLLPDDGGVRWTDGATEVLWLFRDCATPRSPGRTVERIAAGPFVPLASSERSTLRAWRVYRLRPAD